MTGEQPLAFTHAAVRFTAAERGKKTQDSCRFLSLREEDSRRRGILASYMFEGHE